MYNRALIMNNKCISAFMAIVFCTFTISACGTTTNKISDTESSIEQSVSVEETATDETADVASNNSNKEEASTSGEDTINALWDVEVDKGIFNVTLTIPKDFVGETTQDELDKSVEENGYKSATLNDDGSVTYVMTKEQHKKMLDGVKEGIDQNLNDMVGSEKYPNITSITTNENYTSFTITTKNSALDTAESFAVIGMYVFGGMYAVFSGEEVYNIHVDFVNADSGEIISSSDSDSMDSSGDTNYTEISEWTFL